jgi:hypothetical protein
MNSSFMIPVPYNYTSTVDTFLKRDLRGREFGIGEFGIVIGQSVCWDGEGLEEGKGRGETPKENCVGADGRGEKIPDFDLGNLGSPLKNRPKAPGGHGQVVGTKDERAEENLGPKGGSAHQKLGRSPSLQASSKFQIGSTMSLQQNYLKHSNPIKVNSTHHNNISILNATETPCHKSKQTGDQKEPTPPITYNQLPNACDKPTNPPANCKKKFDIIFDQCLPQDTHGKLGSSTTFIRNQNLPNPSPATWDRVEKSHSFQNINKNIVGVQKSGESPITAETTPPPQGKMFNQSFCRAYNTNLSQKSSTKPIPKFFESKNSNNNNNNNNNSINSINNTGVTYNQPIIFPRYPHATDKKTDIANQNLTNSHKEPTSDESNLQQINVEPSNHQVPTNATTRETPMTSFTGPNNNQNPSAYPNKCLTTETYKISELTRAIWSPHSNNGMNLLVNNFVDGNNKLVSTNLRSISSPVSDKIICSPGKKVAPYHDE